MAEYELTGQVLAGRYQVAAFIGRGGMADVYRAVDRRQSGLTVALKVLRDDLSDDPVFLRRFRREAGLLARLQHPNIVRYYGLEEFDGLAFMVMEYVDGRSLRAEMTRLGRPLTPGEATAVLLPVCRALDYAHGQGILHCDVKPANVLLEREGAGARDRPGRILLSDFGISRWAEAATTTFAGAGTPAYMSPEQCRGTHIVAQSDIYSLSVTLYELLTQDRPFTGDTGPSDSALGERIRWEHLRAPAPAPSRLNPAITPIVEQVILAGLAKDPERRPARAGELCHLLIEAGATPAAHLPWDLELTEAPAGPRDERRLAPGRGVTGGTTRGTGAGGRAGSVAGGASGSRAGLPAGVPYAPTARWPLFAGLSAVAILTLALALAWPALRIALPRPAVPAVVTLRPTGAELPTRPATTALPVAALTQAPVAVVALTAPTVAPLIAASPIPAPTVTQTPPPPPSNVYLEYVLDASNSMMEPLAGGATGSESKWQAARAALAEHWQKTQPPPNAGLRAYGHRQQALDEKSCQDTELLASVAAGQIERLKSLISGLSAPGMSPLGKTLSDAAGDFTLNQGRANGLILVADGADNCGVDPCQRVRFQREGGIRYPIYVAGLNVGAPARQALTCIADASGGKYRDVDSREALVAALDEFVALAAAAR